MAQYEINFQTNASRIEKELVSLQGELVKTTALTGRSIKIDFDASGLSRSINTTFRKLNREIENNQRKLSRLQIGGPGFQEIARRLGRAEGLKERGQMIAEPIRLRQQAGAFEPGSLVATQKVLQALRIEASQVRPNSQEWVKFQAQIGEVVLQMQRADKAAESIQLTSQLGALNPQSLAALETRLTILRNRAREIAPNTSEWQKLNKEIQKTEQGIEKVSRKPLTKGQRLGAAGGAYLYGGGMGGGVGSAVGGIAGGLLGGVPGAFTGAAIGQTVDNLGMALSGITKQAAAVQQMQRGLALASIDAKDFAEAQATVASMSQRLLMPLEQTTRLFTQLRVNTKQYNLSVADTAKIMEGTALAIMATGGSSEDLEGAMRAVVQIFSKGGVQAEELRGQLGERFPGAVVKFAQANKMSFEELQKGLENGEIGVKEFVEFAKKNYTDYAKFSEQLATAPEFAGKRLQLALEQISLEIGGLFGPMGADIQDTLTMIIQGVSGFIKENRGYLRQLIRDFQSIVGPIANIFMELSKVLFNFAVAVGKVFQSLFSQIRQSLGMANLGETKVRLDKAAKAIAGKERPSGNVRGGGAFQEYDKALAAYKALGGDAAWAKANAPAQPSNLQYGGPGAGMSLDRQAKEEKDKKAKAQSLESFERLRDQLADAYNRAEIERIKTRYELEKRLREDLFDIQLTGANRIERKNIELVRALEQAERNRFEKVLNAQLDVAQEAGRVAGNVSGAKAIGAYLQGNIGPTSTGPHFDVKKVGGGYFPRNYLDQFVQVNGRPLSSGTTVPGGTFAGHQRRGSHGWDYAFGPGRHAATLTGGAQWMEGLPTEHGERRRFRLPSGEMFQFLHGKSEGVGAGQARKVGSNEVRDTLAAAKVEIAQGNVELAKRNALLIKGGEETKTFAQYVQDFFGLPDLKLSNDMLKMRNELLEQGASEEQIAFRERLFELDAQYNDLLKRYPQIASLSIEIDGKRVNALAYLTQKLNEAKDAEKGKNDETRKGIYIQERTTIADQLAMARAITPDQELRASIAQKGFTGPQAETLFQETKTLQGAQKLKEQLQGIASSIGDSFGTAFKGIITGTATVQDALAGMFQSIADSFADMVAKMIAEWLKAQILQGFQAIFSAFTGGLGGGFSGLTGGASGAFSTGSAFSMAPGSISAAQGITMFPFANGGIAVGGFRAFANGGIVAGPTLGLVGEGRYNEAIVPLPDGKSIPVDLGGAAGNQMNTNITVNVNNGQAQSNATGSNSSELGRKIEGAVKQVIVGELRPGGLLASR